MCGDDPAQGAADLSDFDRSQQILTYFIRLCKISPKAVIPLSEMNGQCRVNLKKTG